MELILYSSLQTDVQSFLAVCICTRFSLQINSQIFPHTLTQTHKCQALSLDHWHASPTTSTPYCMRSTANTPDFPAKAPSIAALSAL